MSRLEDLEKAIVSLTADEFREFRRWFLKRDWEQWDRQIEEDARAGKLNFLLYGGVLNDTGSIRNS